MTYHVCLGCDNVWFGGVSDNPEHETCSKCRPEDDGARIWDYGRRSDAGTTQKQWKLPGAVRVARNDLSDIYFATLASDAPDHARAVLIEFSKLSENRQRNLLAWVNGRIGE